MLFNLVFGSRHDIRRAIGVLLLLLLPSLAFVSNNQVWDDIAFLKLHSAWTMPAMFGPYLDKDAVSSYWRPLTVLTIAVPALLHVPFWLIKLTSVVLYFFKGVLALLILDAVQRARGAVASNVASVSLAALLALHPLFVESTFWVSARGDLLLSIFILCGVLVLVRAHTLAQQNATPPPGWRASLVWLVLTVAACGAKDTGFVWSALAILICAGLFFRLDGRWKRHGLLSAAGGIAGCVIMVGLRTMAMPQHGSAVIVNIRGARSFADHLQVFCEFLFRGLVNIFAPLTDLAPYKTAGWFSGTSVGLLLFLLTITALAVILLIYRLARTDRTAALLTLVASAMILFHTILSTAFEPTLGTVFSPRYIDPSTTLLFIAMALMIDRPGVPGTPARLKWPVIVLIVVLLLQSLAAWTDARMGWYSNLDLWRLSWDNNSRARQVNFNYVFELAQNQHFPEARTRAKDYLRQYPVTQQTDIDCKMYAIILDADRAMGDQADGEAVARDAMPIARCSYNLANDVTAFLLEKQCPDVLTMLRGTLAVDDSFRDSMGIIPINPARRRDTVLNTAFAELRCGDRNNAAPLIERAAQFDPSWQLDGPKARHLIERATAPASTTSGAMQPGSDTPQQ